MVREIIDIQVGQCGIQVGQQFWKSICKEHGINRNGELVGIEDESKLNKIDVYYQETIEQKYIPRTCLIDLEPGMIDTIKESIMSSLYKPDNMCYGVSGTGNNWCKGHYTEGAEIIDEVMDIIYREAEACDCPQGFQLTHSLGGGTGSGLGTLILLKIRDHFPDRITATFSIFPSPKVSDVVVEPYNATLSIHQLLENSDETFVFDNEALFNISHNLLKLKRPKYKHLNFMIANVMSGCTASFRYSGELNSDLRKLGVNLVPFPRLHFFSCSYAPLLKVGDGKYMELTIPELTAQMWSKNNCLANIQFEDGKFLSTAFIYRSHGINSDTLVDGYIRQVVKMNDKQLPMDVIDLFHKYCSGFRGSGITSYEVDDEIAKMQQKMDDDFVTWIPNNIKTSIVNVGPYNTSKCGTFIANTTAIKGVFSRISKQFTKMYRRHAFLHWYKGEGMDSMEFQECDKNCRDLITEFQDKQDAIVDLSEDDDYDEDDDEDDSDEYEEEDENTESEDEMEFQANENVAELINEYDNLET